MAALASAYGSVRIGDPMDESTLVGPLIDRAAFDMMQEALSGTEGRVTGGQRVLEGEYPEGYYVQPALVEMPPASRTVQKETFAPILYIYRFTDLDEAIRLHNGVPQGLSSAIFTNDIREAERFVSAAGSDCGIANVNIGTSGAEIGGAFGGEKETGGGRESGSDAWKGYMRPFDLDGQLLHRATAGTGYQLRALGLPLRHCAGLRTWPRSGSDFRAVVELRGLGRIEQSEAGAVDPGTLQAVQCVYADKLTLVVQGGMFRVVHRPIPGWNPWPDHPCPAVCSPGPSQRVRQLRRGYAGSSPPRSVPGWRRPDRRHGGSSSSRH